MNLNNMLQIGIFMCILILSVKPLGIYMAHVFEGKAAANRWFGSAERSIYRFCGVNAGEEMNWKTYAFAMLYFAFVLRALGPLLNHSISALTLLDITASSLSCCSMYCKCFSKKL